MKVETFQEFLSPDTLHRVLGFEDLELDSMGRPHQCCVGIKFVGKEVILAKFCIL